eukprot:SAG31_NODE_4612_length_3097_cov_2.555704_4_plen_94_part_00
MVRELRRLLLPRANLRTNHSPMETVAKYWISRTADEVKTNLAELGKFPPIAPYFTALVSASGQEAWVVSLGSLAATLVRPNKPSRSPSRSFQL